MVTTFIYVIFTTGSFFLFCSFYNTAIAIELKYITRTRLQVFTNLNKFISFIRATITEIVIFQSTYVCLGYLRFKSKLTLCEVISCSMAFKFNFIIRMFPPIFYKFNNIKSIEKKQMKNIPNMKKYRGKRR